MAITNAIITGDKNYVVHDRHANVPFGQIIYFCLFNSYRYFGIED